MLKITNFKTIKSNPFILALVIGIFICSIKINTYAQVLVQHTFLNGLPSNFVYQTSISNGGLLYLATQKGIAQFDGYRFQTMKWASNNTSSIFIDDKNCYFQDNKLGLVKYNFDTEQKKILLKINYEDNLNENDHYDNIFVDSKKRVWSTDFNAVKYFDERTNLYKRFVLNKDYLETFTAQFYELSATKILVVSTFGLYQIDTELNLIKQINNTNFLASKQLNPTTFLLSSFNTLYFYQPSQQSIKKATSINQNGIIKGICTESNKQILLYNQNTIYKTTYQNISPKIIYQAKQEIINSVQYDSLTNVIWISTNKGLIQYQEPNTNIEILKRNSNQKSEFVECIVKDNEQNIWVASKNALGYFNTAKIYKNVPLPNQSIQINDLYFNKNQLYVVTTKGLFYVKNDKFFSTKIKIPLKKIAIDLVNNIWTIDLKNKITVFDFAGNELKNILQNQIDSFWKQNVWKDIFIDNKQQIWLAGYMPNSYGIAKYYPQKKQFLSIADLNKHQNFIGDYFNRIALYDANHLIFSGYGGLNVITADGKITQKINTIQYKIDNDELEGIYTDADKNIYFGTAEGLQYLNYKNQKTAKLTELDGLPSNNILYALTALNTNDIAIGVLDAVAIIHKKTVFKTKLLEKLKLTSVKIENTFVSTHTDTIVLNPDQRNVSLYFSALNFEPKETVFYKYRIDGNHWISLDNIPTLSLNQIEQGNYTIQIEAEDNLGNIQAKKLFIYLIVKAPFYKQLWFSVLVVLCTIGLAWIILWHLYARKRKIDQLSAKIKEAEMQTLRSQMNPHFIFNTLNSINSYIIENKREVASEYLTTFSKLMRNILDLSKHETITLEKELTTLKLYMELEALRLENKFDYAIIIDKNIDQEFIKIPPLIIQPFVENAIWHGLHNKKENGHINIRVDAIAENQLLITVEDDGIGRKASGAMKKQQINHKSYGIEITMNRLQLLNEGNKVDVIDLYDELNNATGTKVEIKINID